MTASWSGRRLCLIGRKLEKLKPDDPGQIKSTEGTVQYRTVLGADVKMFTKQRAGAKAG